MKTWKGFLRAYLIITSVRLLAKWFLYDRISWEEYHCLDGNATSTVESAQVIFFGDSPYQLAVLPMFSLWFLLLMASLLQLARLSFAGFLLTKLGILRR